jgi:hypothetical protein
VPPSTSTGARRLARSSLVGRPWRRLARAHSTDPSCSHSGDLPLLLCRCPLPRRPSNCAGRLWATSSMPSPSLSPAWLRRHRPTALRISASVRILHRCASHRPPASSSLHGAHHGASCGLWPHGGDEAGEAGIFGSGARFLL